MTTYPHTYEGFNEVHELLAADAAHRGLIVKITTGQRGWTAIDIHNDPARQIDPNAKLDFVRLVQEDEGYWKLYHFSHNEVIKGEATFTGSLIGAMYGAVHGIFECM